MLRRYALLAVPLALLLAAFGAKQPARQALAPAAAEGGISVYFSPRGGCTDAIVGEIDAAKKSVGVQAYRLTSKPIVQASSGRTSEG